MIATDTMMKIKELSIDMRDHIVTQRNSEGSGKGYKAISKALGAPVSAVGDIPKRLKEYHAVAHLKGRGREVKVFLQLEYKLQEELGLQAHAMGRS